MSISSVSGSNAVHAVPDAFEAAVFSNVVRGRHAPACSLLVTASGTRDGRDATSRRDAGADEDGASADGEEEGDAVVAG